MDPSTSGGIMIYNASTSSSDSISLGGNKNSSITLTAPTSGNYAGIAVFQNRSSTAGISTSGNGSITVNGTFYAPNAALSFGGNGALTAGQVIAKSLSMNGNGNTTVNYGANATPVRNLQLVE
jgi:hypothetical protein